MLDTESDDNGGFGTPSGLPDTGTLMARLLQFAVMNLLTRRKNNTAPVLALPLDLMHGPAHDHAIEFQLLFRFPRETGTQATAITAPRAMHEQDGRTAIGTQDTKTGSNA